MRSRIIVDLDFDTQEPFLKIQLRTDSEELADKTLKFFLEEVNRNGVELVHTDDKNYVELRIQKELPPLV